jgi:DNA-directed RNA polymerase II subunit RPB11
VIFKVNKEDHTLGNLMQTTLVRFNYVLFAGYIVEHPNEPYFKLRIQTDGTVTPEDALINAASKNITDLSILSIEFQKEWELKMLANQNATANATAGNNAGGAGGADGTV